jgi:hypothetical protein
MVDLTFGKVADLFFFTRVKVLTIKNITTVFKVVIVCVGGVWVRLHEPTYKLYYTYFFQIKRTIAPFP